MRSLVTTRRWTETYYAGMTETGAGRFEGMTLGGRQTTTERLQHEDHPCLHCDGDLSAGEYVVGYRRRTVCGLPAGRVHREFVNHVCSICWRELHPEYQDKWRMGPYSHRRDGYKWADQQGPHLDDAPTFTGGMMNPEAQAEVDDE